MNILGVKGCIITIDAMGFQKDIAKTAVARKADYLLVVKENQERLFEATKASFDQSGTHRDGKVASENRFYIRRKNHQDAPWK